MVYRGLGRVLFFNSGHIGHVNPTLELVHQLTSRGVAVDYFCPVSFREKVEIKGATWHNYGSDDWNFTAACKASVRDLLHCETDSLIEGESLPCSALPVAVSVLPYVLERTRALQPDLIIFDAGMPWGILTGKILGIPAIASCSSQMLTEKEQRGLGAIMVDKDYTKAAVGLISQEYGIEYEAYKVYCNYTNFTIVWSLPEFATRLGDFTNARYFGASISVSATTLRELDPPLDDFVSNAEAAREADPENGWLVYVSMGTVVGQEKWNVDAVPFFKAIVSAFGNHTKHRVILVVGRRQDVSVVGEVPSNVIVRQAVPQQPLLKRIQLFITHGGNNSITEALFYAVPMLVLPVFGDQGTNARYVTALGLGSALYHDWKKDGPRALDLLHLTPEKLTDAVSGIAQKYSEIKGASIEFQKTMQRYHDYLHNQAVDDIVTYWESVRKSPLSAM